MRKRRFGERAIESNHEALQRLEQSLFEDRLAVLLFLAGIVILVHTFLKGPYFQG